MRVKLLLKNIFSCLLFAVPLVFTTISAQTFEHVESVAGLGMLQGNNGAAVADYDGDLDLDIFVVAVAQDEIGDENTYSRLLRNDNDGSFTDVTEFSGLINLLPFNEHSEGYQGLRGFKHGASWGDYNNDGFPDIFFTHSFKVQLFRNQGDGTFVEVTEEAGFSNFNTCRNTGSTWFDYNNDSFLDIYINDWNACGTNSLYKNNGDGTFQNVTVQAGVLDTNELASYVALPFDFNNDGWMDLYVSNDFSDPNNLFINQSGNSFVDQASDYGLDNMIDDMAIAIGDFNVDGNFDFFITGRDENSLLQNNGNNNFYEASAENNILGTGWAWGARFADFDLDGDEDLFIVNGFEVEARSSEYNVYYKNLYMEGQNTFSDFSTQTNLNENTISVEALDFDYDNDGDLDLYVTNGDGPSFLYENKLLNYTEENNQHWFKVSLQGTISNRDAIGTTLTLTTATSSIIRYYSGVGLLGQSLQAVHFGLNDETEILELSIKWPSGLVETYQNLSADITVKVIEEAGLEVLDIQPSQKIFGCTDPNACSYNPEATIDDGSCTYLTSQNIDGALNSGFFKVENYTYPISDNSSAYWEIIGGEILNGQGSDTVTVKWHIGENGIISVTETDYECSSLKVSLSVNLSISQIPDDKSIARLWNEILLEAIRGDYARPTVHARNLFHTSIAMYDAWAIYDENAKPYLIGNEVNGFSSDLIDFIPMESVEESRKKALSYAVYRLLNHRFQDAPSFQETKALLDLVMDQLGYDTELSSTADYQEGNAAALGNYIAETIINYGNQDGSREESGYDNAYYEPVNSPLAPNVSEYTPLEDPNRWQPLSLDTFIDQSGNLIPGSTPEFLSPEWGNVLGFALKNDDRVSYQRNGNSYHVYHDPQAPPNINETSQSTSSDAYKWGFSLVSVWGSHLDPNDGVIWDISPKSIGNINLELLPTSFINYPNFYNLINGGDIGTGRELNPFTNTLYQEQLVPRGDYARVLAEFWADGPDSETPPGHWFTILNYVNDSPFLERKFQGQGDELDYLEWDIKSYFILGGAMHDAAISAWSIKGWYDYIRPISAIRYMANNGQSSNPSLSNYHIAGIPLQDGFIESVENGDPLAGSNGEHIGKIKLFTWKGPDYIDNEETDQAGVGWILAENWWPYQRPTFVTPPFAGYVSGHSTYSRAAAETLTKLTGSEFFPGGMGEFIAKQNDFLVFEEGPSMDVKLQWATYRDASDQCSLSRIWGGIHPPADDIPGRLIGERVGVNAFNFAISYFNSDVEIEENTEVLIYPNPVISKEIFITNTVQSDEFRLFDLRGRSIKISQKQFNDLDNITTIKLPISTSTGFYILYVNNNSKMMIIKDE